MRRLSVIGKERPTQINRRGIECVYGVDQFEAHVRCRLQAPHGVDESLREVGIDAPSLRFVRSVQRRPRNRTGEAHVIELRLHGSQRRLEITQAVQMRESRERQAQK